MRRPLAYPEEAGHPRLHRRAEERHAVLYTESLAPDAGSVYGERTLVREGALLRHWDPFRSKLGAALARGESPPLPKPGERWLYLGASTGTTVSHVADLLGPEGTVIAVERSLRPFARLLRLAERYPNILPLLADARRPEEYAADVRSADGLYADIAQPDQVEILLANARLFLGRGASVLFVLKTASLSRERDPKEHLADARRQLIAEGLEVGAAVALEPFHRRHYLIVGRATPGLIAGRAPGGAATRPPGRPAARRR